MRCPSLNIKKKIDIQTYLILCPSRHSKIDKSFNISLQNFMLIKSDQKFSYFGPLESVLWIYDFLGMARKIFIAA